MTGPCDPRLRERSRVQPSFSRARYSSAVSLVVPLVNALVVLLLFAPAIAALRGQLWVMSQMRSRVPAPLRDELALRFALDGFVLQEHTPLAIRRAYVRSHAYGCASLVLGHFPGRPERDGSPGMPVRSPVPLRRPLHGQEVEVG